VAVRKYVEDEEMFLANYSDGLTDLELPKMIETFEQSGKVASFLAVPPSQSFHLVDLEGDAGDVASIRPVGESGILINGGFFALRNEIFDYIEPGEELVVEPFHRLIKERKLLGYRCDRFWCMDTFKEQQILTDLYNSGSAPWEVWKGNRDTALVS
jgi:glucose-1-phosphate cytidylyltransferase